MTTAHIAVDSFTTIVNGERRFVRRGASYAGDDPIVVARPTLFRPVKAFHPEAEAAPKPKRTIRRRK